MWSRRSSPSRPSLRKSGSSSARTFAGFVREVWRIVPPVRSIVRTAFGSSGTGARGQAAGEGSGELFERLRALRKRLASEQEIAPYMVFSDATLRDMCDRMPRTDDEFLAVNGVGQTKLERYGDAFLDEISAFENR